MNLPSKEVMFDYLTELWREGRVDLCGYRLFLAERFGVPPARAGEIVKEWARRPMLAKDIGASR